MSSIFKDHASDTKQFSRLQPIFHTKKNISFSLLCTLLIRARSKSYFFNLNTFFDLKK